MRALSSCDFLDNHPQFWWLAPKLTHAKYCLLAFPPVFCRGLMSSGSSWRSASSAEQYRHHDYADFAQEFLKRNADYQQDHAATVARIALFPERSDHESEGLARRWGLSFPLPPAGSPAPTASIMVARHRARRGDRRNCRSSLADPAAAQL